MAMAPLASSANSTTPTSWLSARAWCWCVCPWMAVTWCPSRWPRWPLAWTRTVWRDAFTGAIYRRGRSSAPSTTAPMSAFSSAQVSGRNPYIWPIGHLIMLCIPCRHWISGGHCHWCHLASPVLDGFGEGHNWGGQPGRSHAARCHHQQGSGESTWHCCGSLQRVSRTSQKMH